MRAGERDQRQQNVHEQHGEGVFGCGGAFCRWRARFLRRPCQPGSEFFWILEISDDGCGAIAHAKSQETLWMVGCRRVEWAPQMSPRAAGALCAPRGSNRRSHVRRSVAAMAPMSGIEGDGSTPATRVQLARTFCKALTSCPFAHSCTHLQLPPNCRRRFLSMALAPLRPQAMGSSERHEEGID